MNDHAPDCDRLIIPPDRATGCNPRQSGVGDWCSLAAEHIPVIPRAEWPNLIPNIAMRPLVDVILDQDGVGSCATESTSQGVMMCRRLAGQEHILLNPWFIYHTTSGGRDQGSSIDTNLRFVRENGIAPESVWPRSKGWRTRPSAEAYEAAKRYRIDEFYDVTSTEEVGTCLLNGFPVVFGWSGHSVIATELIDTQTFRYCNSWSSGWGDLGFGTLRLSSINWGYGAFAIRTPMFRFSDLI